MTVLSSDDDVIAVEGRYSLAFEPEARFTSLSLFLLHLNVLGIYGNLTLGPFSYLSLHSPICPYLIYMIEKRESFMNP